MKKYIKASDGSFVSFAKKAKTTFNPVTAACGGKKKVAAGSDKDYIDVTVDYPKELKKLVESGACDKHEVADYVEAHSTAKRNNFACDESCITLYDVASTDVPQTKKEITSILYDFQEDCT